MENLLILYNPYYQQDVIEQHVKVLTDQPSTKSARVAFGKVRSKLNTGDLSNDENLKAIYSNVSESDHLQLFLTDYANVYVARVVRVLEGQQSVNAPSYYAEKGFDVENWFIISDIRCLVENDFEMVRDQILSNFTTPAHGDHHFAIYGNAYSYPLVVAMDKPVDFFDHDNPDYRYFTDLYKSALVIETKRRLIENRFGEEIFYALHPNSQDAIISAEIEYQENKNDPLYDFSSVVIKLAKSFEKELYLFLLHLFSKLMQASASIELLTFQFNKKNLQLAAYQEITPNMGLNKFLLKHKEIKQVVKKRYSEGPTRSFILTTLPKIIDLLQPLRNETAHGEAATLEVCQEVRRQTIGIGVNGAFCDLIIQKKLI